MESGLSLDGGFLLPITNVDLKTGKTEGDRGANGRYVRVEFMTESKGDDDLNPIVGFVMNHQMDVLNEAEDDRFLMSEGPSIEILEVEIDPNFLISHEWMRRNLGFGLETMMVVRFAKVSQDSWGLTGVWRLAEPEMCEWYTVWPVDTDIQVSLIGSLAEERREFLGQVLDKLRANPNISPEELILI